MISRVVLHLPAHGKGVSFPSLSLHLSKRLISHSLFPLFLHLALLSQYNANSYQDSRYLDGAEPPSSPKLLQATITGDDGNYDPRRISGGSQQWYRR